MRSITMLMNKIQFCFVTFFLLSVIFNSMIASSITSREVRRPLVSEYEIDIQHTEESDEKSVSQIKVEEIKDLLARKVLIETTSTPKNCTGHCNKCVPCRAVTRPVPHLPNPPPNLKYENVNAFHRKNSHILQESKPEVWECKCFPPKK
ncbi:EPIDERMAL PATTERNING FACTOR-like protein 6 [Vicia villosa]|uniref:EPIDERMAL PATTERNING FACTOR-like protein 6 n=1 Tax=Vicia villosa TaxID=3911 RepID=UPI00273A9085|nr:EPIDERMAL PATTERNING FACTOR-like protein 6 [Vicia villosa]